MESTQPDEKCVVLKTIRRELKVKLFLATVKSVLMYGCEAWMMTAKLTKAIDGVYSKMSRVLRQVCWRDNITNREIYGSLPKLSKKIQQRQMQFVSHCYHIPELVASQLVRWQPIHVGKNRGRQLTSCDGILLKDTMLKIVDELVNSMDVCDV